MTEKYGFADVLSVEQMLEDLARWQPKAWADWVGRRRHWTDELFDWVKYPRRHECRSTRRRIAAEWDRSRCHLLLQLPYGVVEAFEQLADGADGLDVVVDGGQERRFRGDGVAQPVVQLGGRDFGAAAGWR